ncbi:Alpha/beta hydrolase family protein [Hartmannibacter diazotrophicus]|uniref:Alpha/beta hydrolase family protein n=1 Tax=Hartmannibacter diazotrophicus TaxID=1482074 RepID=A0A2C9D1Q2_9HYPH|nr:alpha/beta family hydrolase [Hartmannibacter diazotrophicus]SON54109.1 Alpha/beta hydrolase family protein [Hartmannibacter diazotrophicus]
MPIPADGTSHPFLCDGPEEARATLLFAHGAGAPMDSPVMNAFAGEVAARGLRVLRFEFAYMAARRAGERKPPPRAERLLPEFREAVAAARALCKGPLLIGGKSMGGRIATMLAGEAAPVVSPAGVVVLGYPFRPPGKTEARVGPLLDVRCPLLILQGTRDPFGSADELTAADLPGHVDVAGFADGDHDLKPRKASGETFEGHMKRAGALVSAFADRLAASSAT